MKKFFEEPSIECIRLVTESITTGTGTAGGNMGVSSVIDPDVPQG